MENMWHKSKDQQQKDNKYHFDQRFCDYQHLKAAKTTVTFQ